MLDMVMHAANYMEGDDPLRHTSRFWLKKYCTNRLFRILG